MKNRIFFLALVCLFVLRRAAVAGEAEMHLYSLSLRFQPATAKSVGLNYGLEFTSDNPTADPLNGELAPLPDGAPSTHGSFYRLTGDVFFEPVYGTFLLNVPDPADANTNGIPDFFEVGQEVAGTTTNGGYDDGAQKGKVTTTWSRNAGSKAGACRLTMDGYGLTFIHNFEIQEYGGLLRYSSTATNVTGTVALTNVADRIQTLSGRAFFEKVSSDQLKLQPGTWTDNKGQAVAFVGAGALDRDRFDYFDIFTFRDGDLSTTVEDYFIWLIKITDTHDTDRNRIPDLSDGPVARQPSLTLSRSSTNLLLNISGEIGQVHQVERTILLNPTNWTNAVSVILTNDPQTVRLPVPTNRTSFWRVKVP